jgi:hypothetical protein
MRHSSIRITFDTYGHLFPGRGNEASGYEKSMEKRPGRTRRRERPTRNLSLKLEKAQ